ncbi:MAG TPA: glycosyl hydrolase family 28 protein [Tepidisphaeraceae bacterium]|nr:glycosyl hydrolase family 28 protein [Tepidisphaeraceae bacterium]
MDEQHLSRRQWVGLLTLPAIAATIGYSAWPNQPAAHADAVVGAQPNPPGARTFNVLEFGARGDGNALDTAAIQSAIDACAADQGGTVLVPAGTFLIGTIELKSNVTLHICAGGTLLGTTDGTQYHAAERIPLRGDSTLNDGNVAIVFAAYAKNVTVEGPGTIDGQGDAFRSRVRGEKPPSGVGGDRRPHSLLFYRCDRLIVRDIFLKASAYHCIRPIQCAHVHFDGINIYNRVNHNNDGFHFISCVYVNVSNCNVMSQDDACTLFGSCQYVTITNCTFSTRWSVFRFGGGIAQNIAVSNCVLYQVYGCPIKMRCGPGSRYENISFSNLVMQDVTGPISIGLGPLSRRARPASRPGTPVVNQEGEEPAAISDRVPGIVRNISFSNIRATVTSSPAQLPNVAFTSAYAEGEIRSCIALNGVNGEYLENITFDNVHVTYGGGGTAEDAAIRDVPQRAGEYFELGRLPAYGMYARGVRGLTLQNVRFQVEQPDLRPALVFDRVEDVAINGLSVQGNPAGESVLRFVDAKQALLSASRVLTPAAVFMRVEGGDSNGIIIDGGDLSNAAQPTDFAAGADQSSVKLRV